MRQKLVVRIPLVLSAVLALALLVACDGSNRAGGGLSSSVRGGGKRYGGGNFGGGYKGGRGGAGNDAVSDLTSGQENALGTAEEYISMSGFSRSGLIEQLKFEGYSTRNAAFAVDHLNINWDQQAVRSAEDYLSMSAFSRSGLIEQLEFEGYTHSQAEYGADEALGSGGSNEGNGAGRTDRGGGANAPTSGQENALAAAQDYMSISGFSRSGLIEQLEFDGYNAKDAAFAADHLNVDWDEQAARSAKDYLSMSEFSRTALIEQLKFEGYTQEQAEYGADKAL